MKKHKLEQFRGALSPANIATGINAAYENACRLCRDARSLLDGGSYPTALSLAALAIEEHGKGAILNMLAVARNQQEVLDAWKEYRTHVRKNVMWPMFDMIREGARRLEDFRPLVVDGAEAPHLLDNLKQLGFYTDCLGGGHWSVPTKVIDQDLATNLVGAAESMVSDRRVTTREVELWIEHMQPVWKQPMEQMEAAFVRLYQQLHKEGLLSFDPRLAEKFITTGIQPSDLNGHNESKPNVA